VLPVSVRFKAGWDYSTGRERNRATLGRDYRVIPVDSDKKGPPHRASEVRGGCSAGLTQEGIREKLYIHKNRMEEDKEEEPRIYWGFKSMTLNPPEKEGSESRGEEGRGYGNRKRVGKTGEGGAFQGGGGD